MSSYEKTENNVPQNPMQQIVRLGKALSLSALNQIVSSGTGFVFGIYLVRVLPPEEFGLYGIGFAVSLLYAGFGNALFLTQMVVHTPDKATEERAFYAARILLMVLLFCAATFVAVQIALYASGVLWLQIKEYFTFTNAVLAASVANLLKNYFICHAYNIQKENKALVTSLSWSITLVSLLGITQYFRYRLDAVTALSVFAGSNFIAALISLSVNKLPLATIQWTVLRSDFLEAFSGGRWAMGGVTVSWLQAQAYMYVTVIFLGPSGVAFANAGRILISPFSFLLPAINQIALPRMAEGRVTNKPKMLHVGTIYALLLLALGSVYVALLLLNLEYILPVVIGDKYSFSDISPLVTIWCFVLLCQLARTGAGMILQALMAFKRLMFDNLFTAVAAVATTFLLVVQLGIPGAIMGTGIGELLLALLLWKRIKHEKEKQNQTY